MNEEVADRKLKANSELSQLVTQLGPKSELISNTRNDGDL